MSFNDLPMAERHRIWILQALRRAALQLDALPSDVYGEKEPCSEAADILEALYASSPPTGAEAPEWQELRDLLGLDGWHDGHPTGLASPAQIVTHVRYVAEERARLLLAALHKTPPPPPGEDTGALLAKKQRLAGALEDLLSWFPDRPSPLWQLPSGQHGVDNALRAARAILEETMNER